ncbi:hypothetical protein DDE03_04020 [Bifidobacterium longum subsp. longum]|nr:hypothetical protein [Bifidobacterium longum subsp. longum]
MPKAMIVPARPPAEGSPFHTRFPIVGLLALAVGSARSKCVLLISVRSPPLRERSKTSCHPANLRSGRRTIRSRQLIQC